MFDGPESLCEYISTSGNASLAKIALPVSEAPRSLTGVRGMGLGGHPVSGFLRSGPGYGGAPGKLVKTEWSDGRNIRAKTSPAS